MSGYHEELQPGALQPPAGPVPLRDGNGGPVIGQARISETDLGLYVELELDVPLELEQQWQREYLARLTMPAPLLAASIRIIPREHFLRYGDVQAVRTARALAHWRILTRTVARGVLTPLSRLLDALARGIGQ